MIAGIHLYGQIPLSKLLNATYTQNFDSLPSSGTGLSWVNNFTIPGWYLSRTPYNADNGGSSAVTAFSFGSNGSTERALGSVAGLATGGIFYGVRFVNDTSISYPGFNLSYFGEQWRKGNNGAAHRLEFGYKISGSPLTNPSDAGFSSVVDLDFVSPVVGASTAAALDGNNSNNRVLLDEMLTFNQLLDPGEEVMFRWSDPDDQPGGDHGLAIDNLSIEIPEAEALPGLVVVGLAASILARRRPWIRVLTHPR